MKKPLGGLLAATVLTSAAYAGTFNVTRTDDPVPNGCLVNDCSLREAVITADQTVAKDTIVLPAGTYLIDLTGNDNTENTGDLDISTDMEFTGAPSTIDGQALGRIMDIDSDASVTLRDITLQNANTSLATNGSLNGGALEIGGGSLTVDSVTFKGNSTQSLGGAIYAFDGAVVNIDNSLFDSNFAGSGAAIHADSDITVLNTTFQNNDADTNRGGAAYLTGTMSDSVFKNVTFDQNTGAGGGGAILFLARGLVIDGLIATGNEAINGSGGVLAVPGTAHFKQVEIVNALLDGNEAENGGAIYTSDDDDTFDFHNSSFIGNTVPGDGGALYMTGGMVNVTNVTFSGNMATEDGGAISLYSASLSVIHATFSENQAARGSNLAVGGSSSISSVELTNNLIDGNCYIFNADTVTSLGGNVEGTNNTCGLDAPSDLVNQSKVQLGLQPLADNPGGTPTHKLTTESVARGQGEPATCASVKVDQLYEKRGSPCNSGADESDTIFKDSFESN